MITTLRYNGGPVGYGISQIPMTSQQNPYSYQQLLPYQYQGNSNFGMPMNYYPYQYNGILGNQFSNTPYINSYQSQLFNSYIPSSSSQYNFMIPSISSLPYMSNYGTSNLYGYTNSGISTNGGISTSSIPGYPSLASPYITNYPFNKKM